MSNSAQRANTLDNSKIKAQDVSLFTFVFIAFSYCCGGCFGIEELVASSGPGLALLILLLLPFFWAAPQALVAAELGSAMPYTGGFYKWIQRGLGEFWGFTAGWCRVLGGYLGIAIPVVLGVDYLKMLVPMDDLQTYLFKAALIIVFTVLNLRGIKEAGRVTTILSLVVLAAFVFVAIVGFMHWNHNPVEPFFNEKAGPLGSFTESIAIGLWVYSGFTSVSFLAGDCKDRSVAWKGILIVIPLSMILYILPTMSGLAAVGQWESWSADSVNYATVAGLVIPFAASLFAIIAFISQSAMFNTSIMAISRGLYAISEDHLAPKILSKVSKSKGVPIASIITIGIFALIGAQFSFGALVTVKVTFLMVDYILIWISGFQLRIKEPDMERPFKIPGGMGVYLLVVIPGFLVAFFAVLVNGANYFWGGMVGICLMSVLYIFIKRICGGLTKIDSVGHPINPVTKLAYGDLGRFAKMFGVFTVLGIIAYFFIPLYEGSWGPEYYADKYGFAGAYDFILQGILYTSIAFACITILLLILDKVIDPKDKRPENLKFGL